MRKNRRFYFVCVTEAIRHWLLSFRDDTLRPLQQTCGVETIVLAPGLSLHHQLLLAEGFRGGGGGGVRGDSLDDDAIAGAETVGLEMESM